MIIIMEKNATAENIQAVIDILSEHGFRAILHEGDVHTVIDALGDNPSGITAYVDLSGMTAGGPRSVDVKVTGDDSRLQYIVTKKVNVVLSKGN